MAGVAETQPVAPAPPVVPVLLVTRVAPAVPLKFATAPGAEETNRIGSDAQSQPDQPPPAQALHQSSLNAGWNGSVKQAAADGRAPRKAAELRVQLRYVGWFQDSPQGPEGRPS